MGSPLTSPDADVWQWYGTRLVWTTVGNDYCPFCEGDMVAAGVFWWHFFAGLLGSVAVVAATGNPYAAAIPALALGYVGAMAAGGFWAHLHGWQSETEEMARDVADEHDIEFEKIPNDE